MQWLQTLEALPPPSASSQYTFGSSAAPSDGLREKALEAFNGLRREGLSAAKRSTDYAIALLQRLPRPACQWLDAATAQLSKDVYNADWSALASAVIGVYGSLCSSSYLRDVIACDRDVLSSVVNVFLVSADPDVLNECLRLFASLMLAVGDSDTPGEVAAAAVVACGDVVHKAVFVGENAVDAIITKSALGFLINVVAGVPGVYTADLEAGRKAAADQAAQAKEAAALAAALGASSSSSTAGASTANAPPLTMLAASLGVVAAVGSGGGGGGGGGDAVLIQLLCRLLDSLLRQCCDDAHALALLLCKADVISAVAIDPSTSASGSAAAPRLLDVLLQLIGACPTPDAAVTGLLALYPYTVDSKVCVAGLGCPGVLQACVMAVETHAWKYSWKQLSDAAAAAGIARTTISECEDEVFEAGCVFTIIARMAGASAVTVSRWKPVSVDSQPPVTIANMLRGVVGAIPRLDTLLHAARFWVLCGRAAVAGAASAEDIEGIRHTANACVDAMQGLARLAQALKPISSDAGLHAALTRLEFVTGLTKPAEPTPDVQPPPPPQQTVTAAPASAETATKKRSRWGGVATVAQQ